MSNSFYEGLVTILTIIFIIFVIFVIYKIISSTPQAYKKGKEKFDNSTLGLALRVKKEKLKKEHNDLNKHK